MAEKTETEAPVGDVVVSAGGDLAVQTVTDPATPVAVAEGDRTLAHDDENAVILVDVPEAKAVTAGELREAGYVVPPTADANGKPVAVPDDEVPTTYYSDTVVGADSPLAVQEVVIPETPAVSKLTAVEQAMLSKPDEEETPVELGPDGKSPKVEDDDAKAKAAPKNKAVASSPENK